MEFLNRIEIQGVAGAVAIPGASGIQFNATKRIGLYLEPELTWSKPPKKAHLDYYGDVVIMEEGDYRLETYRTVHPFMFTVATGLRVNLGKQAR